uniref:Uncharacterized protein n=1 Tax=Sparus aurata TaxID=8175 RepID=A0A671VNH2_SPAAU
MTVKNIFKCVYTNSQLFYRHTFFNSVVREDSTSVKYKIMSSQYNLIFSANGSITKLNKRPEIGNPCFAPRCKVIGFEKKSFVLPEAVGLW